MRTGMEWGPSAGVRSGERRHASGMATADVDALTEGAGFPGLVPPTDKAAIRLSARPWWSLPAQARACQRPSPTAKLEV
jgi:hypothetical protein